MDADLRVWRRAGAAEASVTVGALPRMGPFASPLWEGIYNKVRGILGIEPNRTQGPSVQGVAKHEGVELFNPKQAFVAQGKFLCRKHPEAKVKRVVVEDDTCQQQICNQGV